LYWYLCGILSLKVVYLHCFQYTLHKITRKMSQILTVSFPLHVFQSYLIHKIVTFKYPFQWQTSCDMPLFVHLCLGWLHMTIFLAENSLLTLLIPSLCSLIYTPGCVEGCGIYIRCANINFFLSLPFWAFVNWHSNYIFFSIFSSLYYITLKFDLLG